MLKQLNVYGIRPVLELLNSDKEIDTIFLQKDIESNWCEQIIKHSKEHGIPLKRVPKHKLNRLTKKIHQGVIAITSHIKYQHFENLLNATFEKGEFPLFLLLDRITDVRNFGSICRSAETMGAHGIIIPNKESAQINEIAIKASSGAINNINICRSDNLEKTIILAKNSGLSVIACSEKSEKNIYDINFQIPSIIVIGSEKNGISTKIISLCDEIGRIPVFGKTTSLNASVAAGIILYEQNRQALINLKTS